VSIEKFITYVMDCDKCSENFDTDETEFMAAKERAKSEGWKTYKNKQGDWEDSCPSCFEDWLAERKRTAAQNFEAMDFSE